MLKGLSRLGWQPEHVIDVPDLGREMAQYDAALQERLRRAALNAIDAELARIRAARSDSRDGA